MAHLVKIFGKNEIKKRLNQANIILGQQVRQGLIKAGLFLQRKSQEVVPIEFGNLKNSAGHKPIGQGWNTDVIVYYTASYAVYVHEITTAQHKPGKIAKYLETPMRENRENLLRIIAGGTAL